MNNVVRQCLLAMSPAPRTATSVRNGVSHLFGMDEWIYELMPGWVLFSAGMEPKGKGNLLGRETPA